MGYDVSAGVGAHTVLVVHGPAGGSLGGAGHGSAHGVYAASAGVRDHVVHGPFGGSLVG